MYDDLVKYLIVKVKERAVLGDGYSESERLDSVIEVIEDAYAYWRGIQF